MYIVFWCICMLVVCCVWVLLVITTGEKTYDISRSIYKKMTTENLKTEEKKNEK